MKRELNFENFYIHEGNEISYLAAQKIIEFPGELFNPFYVYSDTGLGKTHLLRAIHLELSKKFTTLFFTAKEFEQYIEEVKKVDTAIIIDDMNSISAKYQQILCEIVDTSMANNRQICLSGSLAPKDMKDFGAKLLLRLESGLVCDVQPPKEAVRVDMIKKKSEELGITLSEDVVTELAQVSGGSIRAIEDMINRLKTYSSLGDLSLDINSVRLVLKEFYPKGVYSPVSSLLSELKKDAASVLQDASKKLNLRDEYKQKIYLWEMKGFDISSLTTLLDGDIDVLKKEYDNFIKKIGRLAKLQKEFSLLNTSYFSDEAMKIESLLFSTKDIDKIEELIAKIKKGIDIDRTIETFGTFIIGKSNRNAYNIYQKQILKNLGEKFNPFIILGKTGTGKTQFLRAIDSDLKSQNKIVNYLDLTEEEKRKIGDMRTVDVLILDNFHHIFDIPEDERKKIFDLIMDYIKKDKEVILGSDVIQFDSLISEQEKIIFELGLEIELVEPSPDLVVTYIKSKLGNERTKKIINRGLSKFTSFHEIDDYINSLNTDIEEEPEVEVVPLGFRGEESREPCQVKETEEIRTIVTGNKKDLPEEELTSAERGEFKMIGKKRYIFPESLGELIEESY